MANDSPDYRAVFHGCKNHLKLPPHMAAREVAQRIGISSRKVEENIAKLKALTLLKRIGPAKGGYWQVTEGQREGT